MPRPRKGQERPVTGVYRRSYADKNGEVHEYWRYVVYVPGPDGTPKPEWRSAPTKKAAEEARADRKVDVKRGEAVQSQKLTLAEYLTDWLAKHAVKKNLQPTTFHGYEMIIETRINPILGRVQLQRLSEAQIEDFLHQLRTRGAAKGKPLSARTIRQTYIVLSEALRQAKRIRLIPRNPCAEIETPQIQKQQQPQWTPEEARKLLALLKGERYEVLYIVALTTGLRRSEVLGLRWQDVDLEQGVLTIRQKLTQVGGKLVFGQKPKTPAGAREVPLHPKVVELLAEHRRKQVEERLRRGPSWLGCPEGGELVFCSRYGTALSPANVYRRLNQLVKRAGITYTAMHGMRRTASTIAHDHSKDLLAVAALLGHASPDVTAAYYAKATKEATRLAAVSVGDVLLG
jgi:integrase